MPGKKGVISGMRASSEVIIEVNMVRAMIEGGIKFYISKNRVVLTPGIEGGYLPSKYFR